MNEISRRIRQLQRNTLDAIVRHSPNLGLDRRAEHFVGIFDKFLEPESRILDIGGGWGFYKEPLRKRGHSLTVVDVVQPGFQKAPVIVYDGQQMPFPDKSFDCSLLITVLHHIPDISQVLKEAARVTRKRVIVIEDLYHHFPGKCWTVFRDMVYNMEFFGHPCQFRKRREWIDLLERGLPGRLIGQQEVYTWLAGLRILNGIFIFDLVRADSERHEPGQEEGKEELRCSPTNSLIR